MKYIFVLLIAFFTYSSDAQIQSLEFQTTIDGKRIIKASVENFQLLSSASIYDFRTYIESQTSYEYHGINNNACYDYSKSIRRTPLEWHGITKCPYGIIMTHAYNDNSLRRLGNFLDELLMQLDGTYVGHKNGNPVYQFRNEEQYPGGFFEIHISIHDYATIVTANFFDSSN